MRFCIHCAAPLAPPAAAGRTPDRGGLPAGPLGARASRPPYSRPLAPPRPGAAVSLLCPHCGRENPPDLIRCRHCFRRLVAWLGDPFGAADRAEDTIGRTVLPSAAGPASAAQGGFRWRYVFIGCGCLVSLFVGFLFLVVVVAILASGLLAASEGSSTRYENFTVWSLPPPEEGGAP